MHSPSSLADIQALLTVSRQALEQDETTPEADRMSCETLLRMAILLLDEAIGWVPTPVAVAAIQQSQVRDRAAHIRDCVCREVYRKNRPAADQQAVSDAVVCRFGPQAIGQTPVSGRD
jgi:hypothetical protein